MFNNIGEKIKDIALFITIIGIFFSGVFGFVLYSTDESLLFAGIIIFVVGSLISWLNTVLLYGFGQIISNSDRIVELMENEEKAKLKQMLKRDTSDEAIKPNKATTVNAAKKCDTTSEIPSESDKAEQLSLLRKWKRDGLITAEEYEQKLEELIND